MRQSHLPRSPTPSLSLHCIAGVGVFVYPLHRSPPLYCLCWCICSPTLSLSLHCMFTISLSPPLWSRCWCICSQTLSLSLHCIAGVGVFVIFHILWNTNMLCLLLLYFDSVVYGLHARFICCHTHASLPTFLVHFCLSYFIHAVPMHNCFWKHLCMSPHFL